MRDNINKKTSQKKVNRSEKGSVVVLVLSTLLFMLLFVLLTYTNTVNKKNNTKKTIETVQEEYIFIEDEVEETMKNEYENIILNGRYKLTYILNGGIVAPENPEFFTEESETIKLTNPIKEGYDFIGWTGSNGTTPQKEIVIEKGSKEDRTYEANYKPHTYTIGFDANNETRNVSFFRLRANNETKNITPIGAVYGEEITLPKNTFEKEGHSFTKWNTEKNGTGNSYNDEDKVKNLTSEDNGYVILYAQWKIRKYTITINPNKGTYQGSSQEQKLEIEYNSKITLDEVIPPVGNTIKFESNGGEAVPSIIGTKTFTNWTVEGKGGIDKNTFLVKAGNAKINANYKNDEIILPKAVRKGYTFKGWSTTNDNTVEFKEGEAYIPNENTTLYAVWNTIDYKINYELQGGIENTNRKSYNVETETFTLKNPTKTGYTFIGWTGSNGDKPNLNVTINKGTIGDKRYTANYKANDYQVKFDGNISTTGTMSNQKFTYDQEQKLNPNKFLKTGYVFIGWNTRQDGSGKAYKNEELTKNITTEGTITLYAQWTKGEFQLTINPNGGTFRNSSSNTIIKNKYETKINIENPLPPTGYKVIFDEKGGNQVNDITTKKEFTKWTLEGSGTLIGDEYTYLAGNGTLKANYRNVPIKLPEATRLGYTFKGWTTNPKGTTVEHKAGEIIEINTNIGLFAIWEINTYNIKYNLNGGNISGNPTNYTVETETFTLKNPTKTGYTFIGWTGTNENNPNKNLTIAKGTTGNKEYTANYVANTYIVKFNGNGQTSGTMANQTFTYDKKEKLEINKFQKAGHGFNAWKDEKGRIYKDGEEILNIITGGEITLTAQWNINQYTLTINPNGGKYNNQTNNTTITKDYNTTIKIANPEPPKGYKITFDEKGGENLADINTVKSFTGWTQPTSGKLEQGNFTFGANNTEIKANYNNVPVNLQKAIRKGYTFKGWSRESAANRVDYKENQSYTATGDITLYAVWEKDIYNIKYNLNGGTAEGNPTNYNVESNNIVLKDANKKGYTFTGWTGSNGITPQKGVTIVKGTTGHKEYTANYTANKYTVKFDGNTATSGTMQDQEFTYDINQQIRTNAFSKTGYIFIGWNTDRNGKGNSYSNNQETKNITTGGTITLYAQWTKGEFNLTINPNGGTYSGKTENTVIKNKLGTVLQLETPKVPVGYEISFDTKGGSNTNTIKTIKRFVNWTKQGEGTIENNKFTYGAGNTTITANYENVPITLPTITKEGYTFKGWADQDGQTEAKYKPGEQYTATSSKKLYAVWQINNYYIDINWIIDGEKVITTDEEIYQGLRVNGQDQGYVKDFWKEFPYGSTWEIYGLRLNEKNISYNKKGTLGAANYGINTEINTINLSVNNANYGNISTTKQHVLPGTTYTTNSNSLKLSDGRIIEATKKEERGYATQFSNWSSTQGTINNKTNIIANFVRTANKYTVKYDANGGAGAPGNTIATYDQTFTVSKQIPTKQGYTFVGWKDSTGGTWTNWSGIWKYIDGQYGIVNSTLTLYAEWTINNYTLTINPNGGKYENSVNETKITKPYKTTIDLKNPEVPSGYKITFDEKGGENLSDINTNKRFTKWTLENKGTLSGNKFTFEDGNGKITANYENIAITLPSATRKGYTFKGWSTNSTSNTVNYKAGTSYTASNNVTLYAVWEINTYNIAYNLNGGNVSGNPGNYNVETANIALKNPSKTGYTFTGWTGSNGTTPQKSVTIVKGTTGNKSYTANYTANKYIVKFDGNGQTSGTMQDQEFTYDKYQNISENKYQKSGYLFMGWNTDKNGQGKQYANTENIKNITTGGTITLYAQWTKGEFDLTINPNGGSYNQTTNPTKIRQKFNTSITIENPIAPKGYEVKFNSNGGNTIQTINTTKSFTSWSKVGAGTLNGKTFTFGAGNTTLNANYKNDKIKLETPTRRGYSFQGWYDGNTKVSADYEATKNVTLVAHWTALNYKVVYNLAGGTNGPAEQSATYDKQFAVSTTKPTRRGYIFQGWYDSTNVKWESGWTGTWLYINGQYGITNNTLTLTARWKAEEYTIVYNANNGQGAPANGKITYDQTCTISKQVPTREGYTFTGWKDSTGGTWTNWSGKWTYINGQYGITNNTLTLYAEWSINSYTLTINPNGGTYNDSKSATIITKPYNTTITINNPIAPSGYQISYEVNGGNAIGTKQTTKSFTGWTTPSIGSLSNGKYTYGAGNSSITANYKNDPYQLPTASKTGYTFKGWSTTNDNTVEYNAGSSYTATQSTKLYAVWTRNEYTITYHYEGGSATNKGSYNVDTETFTLNNPNKAGYTFIGWTGSNGTTPSMNVTIGKGTIGNKSYVANYRANSYTVKFDGNGATSGSMSDQGFTYDSYQKINTNKYSREGYIFAGWNTDINGNGKAYSNEENTRNITTGGTITLYAQWSKGEFDLSINPNGGKYNNSVNVTTIRRKYGTTIEIANPTAPAGYQVAFNVRGGNPVSNIQTTKSFTNWTLSGKGTLSGNKFTFGTANGNLTANYKNNAITLPTATRNGYTFKGWSVNNGGTVNYKAGESYTATESTTLYAVWETITYNISYDLAGGNVSGNPSTFTIESSTITLKNPSKTGYTFTGWTGSNGSKPSLNVSINTGTIGNKSYTANYVANTYTVTFNGNGATGGTTASKTFTYDKKEPLTTNGFYKTGYSFAKWTTSSNGQGSSYTNGQSVLNLATGGNVTLYAQWTINSYTLSINPNGGKYNNNNGTTIITKPYNTQIEISNPTSPSGYQVSFDVKGGNSVGAKQTTKSFTGWSKSGAGTLSGNKFTYGAGSTTLTANYKNDAITLPSATRTGYTFKGWSTTDDNTIDYNAGNSYTTSGNSTLYAVWEINSYYFDLNWTLNGVNTTSISGVKAGLKINGVDQGYVTDYYKEHPYQSTWEIYGLELDGTRIGYTKSGKIGNGYTEGRVYLNSINFGVNNSSYGSISRNILHVLPNTTFTTSGKTLKLSDGRTVTTQEIGKTGYTTYFNNWSMTSGTIDKEISVNANFGRYANTYTVTFNGNGATGGSTATKTFTYDKRDTLTTNGFYKTGYSFSKWTTSSNGQGSSYGNGESVLNLATGGNVNLYAQWTINNYTLTINPNGGSYNNDSNYTYITKPYNTQIEISNPTSPSGYQVSFNVKGGNSVGAKQTTKSFTGWSKSGAGTLSGNKFTYGAGSTTLTANYKNDAITLPSATKTGYTFKGWSTTDDNTVDYNAGSSYTTSGNTTLYAVWAINYYYIDLNWTVDGDSSHSSISGVKAGLKIGGVDKGYVQDYCTQHAYGTTWEIYGLELDGTKISYSNSGTLGASSADARVYLNTISIGVNNGNYGSVSSSYLHVKANTTYSTNGQTLTLSDGRKVTTTVKNITGYTTYFNSWSQASGTINKATYVNANYGRYANTYTVTFNGNGATSGSMNVQTFTYDSNQKLYNNGFSKTGYSFGGWSRYQNGSGTIYSNGQSVGNLATGGNVNLYAKWNINNYNLYINPNGGKYNNSTQTTTINKNYGATTKVENPVPPTGYQVSFNSNYGSSVNPVTSTKSFAGWSKSGPGTINSYNEFTFGAGNTTLTATYSNNSVNLPTPTRRGYTFAGWYNGGTRVYSPYTPSSNVTLTASWTAQSYTITYDANGGTGAPGNTYATFEQKYTLSSTKPSKKGYNFKHWIDPTGEIWQSGYSSTWGYVNGQYGISGNVLKLKAVWEAQTFTIIYNVNGGNDGPATQYVKYNETCTISGTKPWRTGYTFTGWKNANGTSFTDWSGTWTYTGSDYGMVNNTLTLYAQWNINNYYLDLNWTLDGNSVSSVSGVKAGLKVNGYDKGYVSDYYTSHQYGTSYEIYGLKIDGVNIGYRRTGTIGGTTSVVVPMNTLLISSNNTNYGNVSRSTIYALNGTTYSTSGSTLSLSDGRSVTASSKYQAGYTTSFSYWNPSSGAINKYFNVTANFVRTANTYTVTFNGNGATGGTTDKQTFTYGTSNYLNSNGFYKTGYSFNGWNTNSNGTGASYSNAAYVSNLATSGNITLYAQWKINSYNVTYNYSYNGGTSSSKTSQYVNYGSYIDLSPTAYKSGYNFVGWNTNASATTGLTSKQMGTSNVTLYAIFSKSISATLKYYDGFETKNIVKTAVIYNNETSKSIQFDNVSAYKGTFRGWSKAPTGNASISISANGYASISGGETYYGSFEYPITATYKYYNGTNYVTDNIKTRGYIDYLGNKIGGKAIEPIPNTPNGWNARGWSIYPSPSAETCKPKAIETDTTFYYSWYKNVNINYYGNGNTSGSVANETKAVYLNYAGKTTEAVFTVKPNSFLKNGYKFTNWNTNSSNSGITYYEGDTIKSTTGVSLYAQWKELITIKVGDFVNYDAGTWSPNEINNIPYDGNGGLPTYAFKFGGFKAGSSKNNNAPGMDRDNFRNYLRDENNKEVSGWRVLDIDKTNKKVQLISAGNPEDFKYTTIGYATDYQHVFMGTPNSVQNGKKARDWKANYANNKFAENARMFSYDIFKKWYGKMFNNGVEKDILNTSSIFTTMRDDNRTATLMDNNSWYWLGNKNPSSDTVLALYPDSLTITGKAENIVKGVRIVVDLKPGLGFKKVGTKKIKPPIHSGVNNENMLYTYDIYDIVEGGEFNPDPGPNPSPNPNPNPDPGTNPDPSPDPTPQPKPYKIKEGDYINYTPTYTSSSVGGVMLYSSEIFKQETLKYQVLRKDCKDGGMDIIGSTTRTKLYLQGEHGYNNGIEKMNEICRTLYGHGSQIKARSVNMEDFEGWLLDPESKKTGLNLYGEGRDFEYWEIGHPRPDSKVTDWKVPTRYLDEEGCQFGNGKKLGISQEGSYISESSGISRTTRDKFKGRETYWDAYLDSNTFGPGYKALAIVEIPDYYWVASRYLHIYGAFRFGVYKSASDFHNKSFVVNQDLFTHWDVASEMVDMKATLGVRPVIHLPASVKYEAREGTTSNPHIITNLSSYN